MTDSAVALITGGSSGLGRSFALALAREGEMDLWIVARSKDRLESTKTEIEDIWRHQLSTVARRVVTIFVADISEPVDRDRLLRAIEESGRAVDLLINSAGVAGVHRFVEMEPELISRMVSLMSLAPVALCRALLPKMIERRKGAIINVASRWAHIPAPFMALYAASKAFLLHFGAALGREVEDHGIRVLTICPGAMDTNANRAAGRENMARALPSSSPDDIARKSLDALRRGDNIYSPGTIASMFSLARILPVNFLTAILKRVLARYLK